MKKIKLYMISKCGVDATDEEFSSNVCTIVSNKKDIMDYIVHRTISENYNHYIMWLECHNRLDDDDARIEYINLILEDNNELISQYTVRSCKYTADAIASLLRISGYCIPVGATYETKTEIENFSKYQEALKKAEKELKLKNNLTKSIDK